VLLKLLGLFLIYLFLFELEGVSSCAAPSVCSKACPLAPPTVCSKARLLVLLQVFVRRVQLCGHLCRSDDLQIKRHTLTSELLDIRATFVVALFGPWIIV
jgi:hypothetical protein